MCGCAVSRRYIDVCYCDPFSVVNVYLDHLKFCVVCINGRRYVCCGECCVASDECDEPTSCIVQPIVAHCCVVMYFGCFDFRGELGFPDCNNFCMSVVNKQFKLLEFVFESVYVDLHYDEISLNFTAGSVCLCGVYSPVVVLGLSVRLSWYPYVVSVVVAVTDACSVCVACVYATRLGCEGDNNAVMGSGGGVVVASAYMGGTRGSCVFASAGAVLEMSVVRGVGGVCDM